MTFRKNHKAKSNIHSWEEASVITLARMVRELVLTKGCFFSKWCVIRARLSPEDFHVSMYVPFLKPHLCGSLGHCYTRDHELRVGEPVYTGPAIWYTLHTFAHVLAGPSSVACDQVSQLISATRVEGQQGEEKTERRENEIDPRQEDIIKTLWGYPLIMPGAYRSRASSFSVCAQTNSDLRVAPWSLPSWTASLPDIYNSI